MTAGARTHAWQADAALIGIALIWGATFVMVKEALADVSTLLFLTLRFSVAAVALALLFRNRLGAPGWPRSLRVGILAGACLFAGFVLQTFGLKYTTAGKAGFITGFYIPLVPIMGALLYRQFPRTVEIIGVAAAVVGMALMTVERSLLQVNVGDLLVLGCTVAYAAHIIVLGRFAAGSPLPALILTQIATAAVLGAGCFWWAEPVELRWTRAVWIALGVTSLFATALAFTLQTWAQQHTTPTRTALILALEPVFALITSYVVTGETFSRRGMAGAGLILASVLLVELKPASGEGHPPT
jgi:drug/metabolite transporter (DMT)-like permease